MTTDHRFTSRRHVLLASGGAVAAALAGCFQGTTSDEEPASEGAEGGGRHVDDNATGQSEGMGESDGEVGASVAVGTTDESEFHPAEIRTPSGSTVIWVWQSDGHNLVPQSQPTGSEWDGVPEPRDEGFRHEHTFEVPGTYEYQCEEHADAEATGTVIVEE